MGCTIRSDISSSQVWRASKQWRRQSHNSLPLYIINIFWAFRVWVLQDLASTSAWNRVLGHVLCFSSCHSADLRRFSEFVHDIGFVLAVCSQLGWRAETLEVSPENLLIVIDTGNWVGSSHALRITLVSQRTDAGIGLLCDEAVCSWELSLYFKGHSKPLSFFWGAQRFHCLGSRMR